MMIISGADSETRHGWLAGRHGLLFSFLLLLLVLLFAADIFTGSVYINPADLIRSLSEDTGNTAWIIFMKFRLPKAITALLAGMALSVSGLQMQTVFRNPMAGPYVLGLSSGASLGVAFVIMGLSAQYSPGAVRDLGNWAVVAAACAGAGAVMMLIMFISARIRDILTVLIIGMMLSGGISAIVSIMQYFSNESLLKSYVIWTMGSLGNLTGSQIKVLLISCIVGFSICLGSVKMLNAMLLGENYASSMGLNIKLSRIVIFAGTSILAGSVTAFCGPIGFIGIAVPHMARIVFRTSDHRVLIPATMLTGGSVMILSDIISQLPGSETVIPVNSVTALIGIPVVLWVILRNRKFSGIY